jgi:uncharacterized membrane protein (DUF4010 family)
MVTVARCWIVAESTQTLWAWPATLTSPDVIALLVALGAGLLIGVERERRKGEGPTRAAAGVRTFVLVALGGAMAALLDSALLLAVGAAGVGGLAIASYLRSRDDDPGLTTEIALIVTYLLGALAHRSPQLAAGLSALVALLLAARGFLHEFVVARLSDREVFDGLLLAGAALVILPLMPDRAVDPLGAINPYVVWKLTVIVLVINSFGYMAQRVLGPGRGLPLAGLFGGFVSSAATIAALGSRTRAHPEWLPACVAGAAWSNVATVAQLALVLGVVNPPLLWRLAPSLAVMGGVAILSGAWFWSRAQRTYEGVTTGRAFQPRQALVFSVTVTTLLVLAAALERQFGSTGALVGITVGGFADAHSAAASAASLAHRAALSSELAAVAVLLAASTNSMTKLVVAAGSGGRDYMLRLAPSIVLMIAGAWAALAVT